jgi:hypothetical protein
MTAHRGPLRLGFSREAQSRYRLLRYVEWDATPCTGVAGSLAK